MDKKIIDINDLRKNSNEDIINEIIKNCEEFTSIINRYSGIMNSTNIKLNDRLIALKYVIDNYKEMKVTEDELHYVYFEYNILCRLISNKLSNTFNEILDLFDDFDSRLNRISYDDK